MEFLEVELGSVVVDLEEAQVEAVREIVEEGDTIFESVSFSSYGYTMILFYGL